MKLKKFVILKNICDLFLHILAYKKIGNTWQLLKIKAPTNQKPNIFICASVACLGAIQIDHYYYYYYYFNKPKPIDAP